LDDISGSGQTAAVHTICSGVVESKQQHLEVLGAGHYGIFSGRRWRTVVYPEVKAFILKYQPKPQAKTPLEASTTVPAATSTVVEPALQMSEPANNVMAPAAEAVTGQVAAPDAIHNPIKSAPARKRASARKE
jgi:poly(3-hydroxybutyrate) depolymerase